ncbi:MAG TPA: 50S ribosomal protein L10 [Anaerolineae bacterium]|nr:50S ribosomal protein L10 [Anaerolineae bacterium]HOQ99810.1 50S ribosomal protein L10 [Anaerolineae bacterium]
MPITREEKEEQIVELAERFRGGQVIVWTEYRGLPTPALNELRRALRPHQAEFHIVKNTLAGLALQRAGLPAPEALLKGPTAAGVFKEDIAGAARALTGFAVTNRELVIKGGQAGQRVLNADEVATLVTLPTREVLLGRVLGGMNAPISGLVNVLAGTMRGLLNVLQAHAKKMEEAEA